MKTHGAKLIIPFCFGIKESKEIYSFKNHQKIFGAGAEVVSMYLKDPISFNWFDFLMFCFLFALVEAPNSAAKSLQVGKVRGGVEEAGSDRLAALRVFLQDLGIPGGMTSHQYPHILFESWGIGKALMHFLKNWMSTIIKQPSWLLEQSSQEFQVIQ